MKNHDLKLEQHMFSSISSACFQSAGGEALPPCFTHGFGRSSVTLRHTPVQCVRVCAAARQRFSPMAAAERRMGLDRLLGGVYHVYK